MFADCQATKIRGTQREKREGNTKGNVQRRISLSTTSLPKIGNHQGMRAGADGGLADEVEAFLGLRLSLDLQVVEIN